MIETISEDFQFINLYNANQYFSDKELQQLYFRKILFQDINSLVEDMNHTKKIVSTLIDSQREGRWPAYHTDENCQALHSPLIDRSTNQTIAPNSGSTYIFNPPVPALVQKEIIDCFQELQDLYSLHQEIIDPIKYTQGWKYTKVFRRQRGTKEYEVQERYLQLKRQMLLYMTNYYQAVHNPKLKFKGSLLDEIGLRPCKYCVLPKQT